MKIHALYETKDDYNQVQIEQFCKEIKRDLEELDKFQTRRMIYRWASIVTSVTATWLFA